VVDLPSDFRISCTFNVEDLVPYRGTFDTSSDPFVDEPTLDLSESPPLPPLPPKLPHATKNIESILDDQIVSIRDGGMRRYLIKWKGKADSENSWITEEDFRQLDPDLLERYQSQQQLPATYSTGSSSSHPRGIDANIMPLRGRFDQVYFKKRRNAILWL